MEPERPVEKLLRAYAKKRAQEAGPPDKLHPATRRLLQDEVKRRFSQRLGEGIHSYRNLLGLFWNKVSWAFAVCLVLGLVSILFLGPFSRNAQHETKLAKNQPLASAAFKQQTALAPSGEVASPPAPRVVELSGEPSVMRSANLGRAASSGDLVRSKVEVKTEPSMTNSADSDRVPSLKQSEAPTTPLSSFQVVQAGQQVQILDEDGSVYTGSIQLTDGGLISRDRFSERASAAPSARAITAAPPRQALDSQSSQNQISRNYFIRVAGTNRTLNQTLVFSGTLTELPTATSFRQLTNGMGFSTGNLTKAQFQKSLAPSNSLPSGSSQISGKLRLGDGKIIDINALSPKQ